MLLLLLWLTVAAAQSCHPECHWVCDDPVCYADCATVCAAPACQVCRNETGTSVCRATPQCTTLCAADQCESDQCPQCETVCPALCGARPDCYVLCEAMVCEWRCGAPAVCPEPICALQCEAPACEVAAAQTLAPRVALLLGTFLILLTQ